MSFDPAEELQRQLNQHKGCTHHPPFTRPAKTVEEAEQWAKTIKQCPPDMARQHLRWLALNDLYYLIVYILGVEKVKTQWHLERCDELNLNCDNIIDAWTRAAGKSLLKTFGKVIQEILRNPDISIGIGSFKSPVAKSFLKPIKTTFEEHEGLKSLFPDVLYKNPRRESSMWRDDSIIVKRVSITKREPTIQTFGVTDNQPTGAHYDLLVYDDIQQGRESIYMQGEIESNWETSLGLSSQQPPKWWMCGVFFRGGSVYENLIERGFTARIRPAVTIDCTSPIWSDESVRETKRQLSPGTWASEWLLDPSIKEESEGFKEEWLCWHDGLNEEELRSCFIRMVIDPGRGEQHHKQSGKTSIWVVAYHPNKRIYILDGVIAPMNLEQRNSWTLAMHRQWKPVKNIGYEHYGLQADVESLYSRCKREGYPTFEVAKLSGHTSKGERIEWLIPPWKNGEIVLPRHIPKRVINGEEIDTLKYFLDNEWRKFPATRQMDGLDALAWLFYKTEGWTGSFPEGYADGSTTRKQIDFDESQGLGSWMAN